MRKISRLSVCVAILAFICACDKKAETPPQKDTIPVTGKVEYNNRPVAKATVTLHAEGGSHVSTGITDDQGNFTLKTYGSKNGAPVGKYKVTVVVSNVVESEPGVLAPMPEEGTVRPTIPPVYADLETTTIEVDLQESNAGNLKIVLK